MSTTTVTQIISRARTLHGGTAAQFDYDLINGETATVDMAIGEATGAYTDQPMDMDAYRALWAEVAAELETRKAAARERGFLGWSTASTGRVRYAR